MTKLFSWLGKLLRSGYQSEKGYAAAYSDPAVSDLIERYSAAVRQGPGGHHKPAPSSRLRPIARQAQQDSNNRQLPAREYDGDYKDLPAFVESAHFAWMAGDASPDAPRDLAFERMILEYLDTLAGSEQAGANLIPRVPSVMVQLLKRMHEENVSGAELSRIMTRDVVLVAAILAEVNNSFYNLTEKVTELSQAILLLGHNRLRMVLAKLSFTPVYNDQLGPYTKATAARIWQHSQKRALICYLLARNHKVDPFMGFLAGLMQDVGLMVALRVFDRSSGTGHLPLAQDFRRPFQQKALLLSARIGQVWTIPEMAIKVVEAQGIDRTGLAKLPLARVMQKADFIARCCTLIEAGQLMLDLDKLRTMLSEAEADVLVTVIEGHTNIANVMV